MSITDQQLSDLRADFGDEDDTVFSDAEISRIWDRVADAPDTTIQHEAALALMFRQVLSQASKLHDYTAGSTSEKLSQVVKHLKDMYNLYRPSLETAQGRQKQMAITTLRGRKHQSRTYPDDHITNQNDDSSI